MEELVHKKAGDMIWVAVANDGKMNFDTGDASTQSLFADIPDGKLDKILEDHAPFTNLVFGNEKETMRITLAGKPRPLGLDPIELTGNTDSHDLPSILRMLDKKPENDIDVVFTTAVFGTGIDIPRLGLMAVMGQPKTTSTYIQSTGRVGRSNPGLVIAWYKATNIRDLNHYENFVGYHRMLQRFVEPISASPFAEESMKQCIGPVLVSLLRNCSKIGDIPISKEWIGDGGAMRMKDHYNDQDITAVCAEIIKHLLDPNIPDALKPSKERAETRVKGAVSGWNKDARNISKDGEILKYLEWTMSKTAENNVVLGTPQHEIQKKTTVFRNVRTSMREIEATANFGEDG